MQNLSHNAGRSACRDVLRIHAASMLLHIWENRHCDVCASNAQSICQQTPEKGPHDAAAASGNMIYDERGGQVPGAAMAGGSPAAAVCWAVVAC